MLTASTIPTAPASISSSITDGAAAAYADLLSQKADFATSKTQALADLDQARTDAQASVTTAISDTLAGNALLVSTFDLAAETTAAQTAMADSRSQDQAAQDMVTAAFNTQKTALAASIQQQQDQDTQQYDKSVQDAADKVTETQTLKADIQQDKQTLSTTTIAAIKAHQDWEKATKQSIANGASSALSVLNVPANISNGIQHVQDLYAELEQLRSSVGGSNYMVFGGILADLVGIRQIQGAIDGADPYTLERWNKWERLFNGVSGGITLVTTAIGISRALSSIVTPCGSPSWGACFVAETPVVRGWSTEILDAALPPLQDEAAWDSQWLIAGIGVVVATGIAWKYRKRREEQTLDDYFAEDLLYDDLYVPTAKRNWAQRRFDTMNESKSLPSRFRYEGEHPSEFGEAVCSTMVALLEVSESPQAELFQELPTEMGVQLTPRPAVVPKTRSQRHFAGLFWLIPLLIAGTCFWMALPGSSKAELAASSPSARETAVPNRKTVKRLDTVRIDSVELGNRLMGRNPLRSQVEEGIPDPDPESWRELRLLMLKDNGLRLWISLLRPLDWMVAIGAAKGETVYLELPEMGAVGDAVITYIGACPEIEPGEGNIVTGKFVHQSDGTHVIELRLQDQAEPTIVTDNHRYWSVDREDFIAAGNLRPGEVLSTAIGTSRVLSTTSIDFKGQLYNLEIHREHAYQVGSVGILAHNSCVGPSSGNPPLWTSTANKTGVENAFRHFKSHGAEFSQYPNALRYAQGARSFVDNPPTGTLTKIRPNGDKLYYNPATNTFAAKRADGALRTMFTPDPSKHGFPTNLDYFNAQ